MSLILFLEYVGRHSRSFNFLAYFKFTTNTFTVSTPALAPLGVCVSPIVALLNHSCDPNAAIVFPRVDNKEQEPLMYLVTLRHISPEEEVCIFFPFSSNF